MIRDDSDNFLVRLAVSAIVSELRDENLIRAITAKSKRC